MERRCRTKQLRRKRILPNRKWSDEETKQIVQYLKSNDMEKPTARLYYSKFVDEYGLDTNWELVRYKVRNMRIKMLKAIEWKNSIGLSQLQDAEAISTGVKRICPFFYDLYEIFSKSKYVTDPLQEKQELNHSCDTLQFHDSASEKSSAIKVEEIDFNDCEDVVSPNLEGDNTNDSFTLESDDDFDEEEGRGLASKRNRCQVDFGVNLASSTNASSTSNGRVNVSSSTQLQPRKRQYFASSMQKAFSDQNKITYFQRAKLKLEERMYKFENEKLLADRKESANFRTLQLALEEKKFEFEQEKALRELELKQNEIEKDERLKILEIQSKERIAMKELEYKYAK